MYFSSRRTQGGFVLRLSYVLLTLFFHLAIFLVALVGLAHFWLPLVGDYKDVLEQELSSFVGNQVSIGQIRVDRSHTLPRWVLENLQLTEANGHSPIHIRKLSLSLDWRESLRTLRPQPAEVWLEGVEFILNQQGDGLPSVQGLTFPLPGLRNTAINTERRTPLRLDINGGAVHWRDPQNKRELSLTDLQLSGEVLPNEVLLQADALFPDDIGESLALDAVLREDQADLNIRTQIFNLAALPLPQAQTYGLQHGALRLDARLKAVADKPLQIHGAGELKHLGWRGNNSVPAMDGINATFSANNAGGKVQVNVKDSTLNYPAWFERPLQVESVTADLEWRVAAQGWDWNLNRLAAHNQDVQVSGTGKLAMPRKKPAHIDLKLQFATQRRVDNVRDYIPAIVPETTAHWLKTAIVQGYVPKGEMLLRGELAHFPFDKKPGEFAIRFDIEQGVLAYLPEWPAAREVSGELYFHNAGMTAKVHSAKIMDLAVQGGTVEIPDMHHDAHLYLDLNTQGDLKAHMDYLQSAPIGRNLRDFMRIAEFSGRSALRLKLAVPLVQEVLNKQGVAVDGVVTLENNRFALPEYHQVFNKLKGKVQFDQHGVTVQQAAGEYRTQPFTLKAHTDKAQRRILLELQQHNNPALFLPESLAALKPYVQGQAAVTTRLTLPAFNASDAKQARLQVQAASDLRGVRIDLPAPLAKTPEQGLPLQVAVELPFDSAQPWQTQVGLGEVLQVLARLAHKGQQATAIGVSLGKATPSLPAEGIQVQGEVPVLDLLAWQQLPVAAASGDTAATSARLPVSAAFSIQQLLLGQQALGKASVNATLDESLQARLQAPQAQASVNLPLTKPANGSISLALQGIDFEKLKAALPQGKTQGTGLSPAAFPTLAVQCHNCRQGDMPLDISLAMRKSRADLLIEKLEIRNPWFSLASSQGRWYVDANGKAYTELQATAHVPDPGQWLAQQGSAAALQGGELYANAQLQWRGAPFEFALAQLNGKVQAHLGKGSLTDVEPGVGRLLGLLDMQRLPARFSLDFRDMTAKGVAFDRIYGNFTLANGVLHTHDTVIEAAAMVAGIQGKTDLVRKQHEQTVTVVPNLRSALPVVGVAVGGFGAGAALLLLNSVTDKSATATLQSNTGMRYHVRGAWDNPEIIELKAPPAITDVDVFAH